MKCYVCRRPSDITCERCDTAYCGNVCRMSDWPTHMHECALIAGKRSREEMEAHDKLMKAAREDDLELAEHVIEENEDYFVSRDLIFIAIENDSAKVLEYLIEHAAMPFKKSPEKFLEMAADRANSAVLRVLMKRTPLRQLTFVNYALKNENDELLRKVIVNFHNREATITDSLLMAKLLEADSFVGISTMYDIGYLFSADDVCFAFKHASLETIKLLIEKFKAPTNKTNTKRQTILHCAVLSNKIDKVEYALTFKINVNYKDTSGKTAIKYCKNPAIKDLLIEHGAKIKQKGLF